MKPFNIPWPGDRDKAFKKITPWKPLHDWMNIFSREEYLPNIYKESADMIIDNIEKGTIQGNTAIFLSPIAYLYRHSFELILKKLIFQGIILGVLEQDKKLIEILENHELYPLWNKVRIVLENIWPEGDTKDLSNVERVIQQFHSVDQSGQYFRYASDKRGNPINKHSICVDFSEMKQSCGNVFSFWEACKMGLDNLIDDLDDMKSGSF